MAQQVKKEQNVKWRIAMDVSPSQIGWALFAVDEHDNIVDANRAGVMVLAQIGDRVNYGEGKRLRRGKHVRTKRLKELKSLLSSVGITPNGNEQNVLSYRNMAVNNRVSLGQIGTILMYIAKHRGFQSPRLSEVADMHDDMEASQWLKERKASLDEGNDDDYKAAALFSADFETSNCATVGEYLYRESQNGNKIRNGRGRNMQVQRDLLRDEVIFILNTHTDLSDAQKQNIMTVMFQQNPLTSGNVQHCSLFPKKKNTLNSSPRFQEMRMWLEVNNLRVIDGDTDRLLTFEEREAVVDAIHDGSLLSAKGELTAATIKKIIRNVSDNKSLDINNMNIKAPSTLRFIQHIVGDTVPKGLADDLTIRRQRGKNVQLKNRLMTVYGYDLDTTMKLITLSFEKDRANISEAGVSCLLEGISNGLTYNDVVSKEGLVVNKILAKGQNHHVERAVAKIGKLVKALNENMGIEITQMFIESTQDLSMNAASRTEYAKNLSKANNAKDKLIEKFAKITKMSADKVTNLSREDKERIGLWYEQGCIDIYDGKNIPASAVLSSAYEVDHIIPKSKILIDGFANKVLTSSSNNQQKGNNSAAAVFGSRMIRANIKKTMPKYKANVLLMPIEDFVTNNDGFLSSALANTGYVATMLRDTVKNKMGIDDVFMVSGRATSMVRGKAGFNTILSDDGSKNRNDLRHHALDALVIGQIDRNLHRTMEREFKKYNSTAKVMHVNDMLPVKRKRIEELLDVMLVSHEVQTKKSGQMFDKKVYHVDETGTWRYEFDEKDPSIREPKMKNTKTLDDYLKLQANGKLTVRLFDDNGKWFVQDFAGYSYMSYSPMNSKGKRIATPVSLHDAAHGKCIADEEFRVYKGDILRIDTVKFDGITYENELWVVKSVSGEKRQLAMHPINKLMNTSKGKTQIAKALTTGFTKVKVDILGNLVD